MPPSMLPRKNRSKRKNAAPLPTQTAKPSTENDALPENLPSDDSKSEGQMSIIHVTCVTIISFYERRARIYTLLIWSYCKRNCRWQDWIQTQQLVLNTQCTEDLLQTLKGLCRNVFGTIWFDFIRITLSKDALRTLCDRVRSVVGRDDRVRNEQGRYEIVLLTECMVSVAIE